MALDKQQILSELGSVMNRLQSADCGCMGKIFSNPPMGASGPTNVGNVLPMGCGQGHCHNHGSWHGHGCGHGQHYSPPCAGEPQPIHNNNMGRPCSNFSNPAQLYADTYSYLNQNLMQPVVNEVYKDLNTITPDNTIMNSNMSPQGQPPVNNMESGKMGDMIVQNPMHSSTLGSSRPTTASNMMQFAGGTVNPTSFGNVHHQKMNPIAGMGPHIMNMMEGTSKPMNPTTEGGKLSNNLLQSPSNPVGGNPLHSYFGQDVGQDNIPSMNLGRSDNPNMQRLNPTSQYVTIPKFAGPVTNMPETAVPHGDTGNNNTPGVANTKLDASHRHFQQTHTHGPHSDAVRKYHSFFPNLTQDKEPSFDPMAVAIQMNPANRQRTAMETMHTLMNNNADNINKLLEPMVKAPINPNLANTPSPNLPPSSIQQPIEQANIASVNQVREISDQQAKNLKADVVGQPIPIQKQQVYNCIPSNPGLYQQQETTEHHKPQMKHIDPNIRAAINQPNGTNNTNPQAGLLDVVPDAAQHLQEPQDPIYPVENQQNLKAAPKYYEYNTLGQPVQMLPAKIFHKIEPNLPQTLSPLPIENQKLKSTISKTSIMGNRRESKSQLRHIYHQYKGSQSQTQQNIRDTNQGATSSGGKLKEVPVTNSAIRHVTAEQMGGDTTANNKINSEKLRKEQTGDVPITNSPQGDIPVGKTSPAQKVRNGLQDMTYPTYYNCSWSFQRRPGFF